MFPSRAWEQGKGNSTPVDGMTCLAQINCTVAELGNKVKDNSTPVGGMARLAQINCTVAELGNKVKDNSTPVGGMARLPQTNRAEAELRLKTCVPKQSLGTRKEMTKICAEAELGN